MKNERRKPETREDTLATWKRRNDELFWDAVQDIVEELLAQGKCVPDAEILRQRARWKHRDILRKERHRIALVEAQPTWVLSSYLHHEPSCPDERVQTSERIRIVLGLLTPGELVIVERLASEWTMQEIAEDLGLTAEAVRQRVSRMRRRLRTELGLHAGGPA